MTHKVIVPQPIRLRIRILQRFYSDRKRKTLFARKKNAETFPFVIEEKQIIKPSAFFQNKIDNLQIGASYINDIIIEENKIFSFWKLIGKPTKKKGFKEGRNLKDGKISSDIGGGLCQLSGIIYFTALRAGLEIVERYNHTIDIYKEEERFAPLGSDATIVYGYKDLRIKNPYPFPVKFIIDTENQYISCKLLSLNRIIPKEITFIKKAIDNVVMVNTLIENNIIAQSFYTKKI